MSKHQDRVLIVDDDKDVTEMLSRTFSKTGDFCVSTAMDGPTALAKARNELPELIILDLMLPEISGLQVARDLKFDSGTQHIPILMLTAKADEIDRLLGFEMGASDYVTKPFSPREVVLRTRAILNRPSNNGLVERKLRAGSLTVDLARCSVLVNDSYVQLTAIEFKLLAKLMESPLRTFQRDQLLNDVWGYSRSIDTRTVDTHIRRLRAKLGSAANLVETVRGYGYRLKVQARLINQF